MVSGSRALYSDAVRERWRHPRFRGTVAEANAMAEDVNPLCGDRVRITARVENDRVEHVRFTGDSCAICSASADVMAEHAEGHTVSEARALEASDILELLRTDVKPTRMRCVTLPLSVLRTALDGRAGVAHGRGDGQDVARDATREPREDTPGVTS